MANETRRREVVVNGTKATVVDMHAHCSIAEALQLAESTPRNAFPNLDIADPSARIASMDAQAIDVEALSINPYWYGFDYDKARDVIKLQNEKLAEFASNNAERFVGLASVALQHAELAAEQLEHAVKQLGLRGALVGGSVNGEELADPKFHPFWAKAEELGCVIFIHPQGTAELVSRLGGNGALDNTIGNPLETTIALSHLIFQGTLDRFPGLKILAAHGGGYLPSYMHRSDAVGRTFPERFTPLKKDPTAYLKDLYYDTIVFTEEALRHLAAEVGASQIVVGTDYPYPWTATEVEHVLGTSSLSDDEKLAILGGTAKKLLKME
jgi:aminocarboxymuconate-semialdehyde decarboxylase